MFGGVPGFDHCPFLKGSGVSHGTVRRFGGGGLMVLTICLLRGLSVRFHVNWWEGICLLVWWEGVVWGDSLGGGGVGRKA